MTSFTFSHSSVVNGFCFSKVYPFTVKSFSCFGEQSFKDAVVIYQTVRLFVLHDNFQMFSVNELQDVINFVYDAVLKRLIYCTLRQLYST